MFLNQNFLHSFHIRSNSDGMRLPVQQDRGNLPGEVHHDIGDGGGTNTGVVHVGRVRALGQLQGQF